VVPCVHALRLAQQRDEPAKHAVGPGPGLQAFATEVHLPSMGVEQPSDMALAAL